MWLVPTLTITRGLPGSGKTTWARTQLRAARLNRDELRAMLHGRMIGAGWSERQVTLAQHAAATRLLQAGVNVICDDTNLQRRVVKSFAEIAYSCDAEFAVRDFTDVPLEVCIARDAVRTGPKHVGEAVIRAMHTRYIKGRMLPLPVPTITPATPGVYHPDPALPEAILVDIDGTVALLGQRDPYDMTHVSLDQPHGSVITAVRAMHAAGHRIVFCSGRSEDARADTVTWLAKHVGVEYEALLMRAWHDHRPDAEVKAEIFEREIRHRWRITAVFDDRNQVVRMWRALGLTVFQVADGSF
jgi:predicted kinase